MRSYILGPLLALCLGACTTLGTPGGGVSSDTITQIQNYAVAACAFLPTATTVASILGANDPKLQTASAVATAICAAVVPTQRALIRTTPMIDGVVIDGLFVTAK